MILKKFILPAIVLFTGFFLLVVRVNKIECYLDNQVCNTDFQNKLRVLQKKSFFFTNFQKEILDKQIADSTYLLDKIEKVFPGTIILFFKQEELKYILNLPESEEYIGNSGRKLASQQNQKSEDFLKIIWQSNEPIIQENTVTKKYHQIFLRSAQTLSKINATKKELIWVSQEEIILEVNNSSDYEKKPRFIFDSETLETQIKKVDTILNARELSEIEAEIVEIDMRFELPVLRTSQ